MCCLARVPAPDNPHRSNRDDEGRVSEALWKKQEVEYLLAQAARLEAAVGWRRARGGKPARRPQD
jgi:hypothetical protein